MGDFQKLMVWQYAKELSVNIYRTTSGSKLSKDFGLRDQLQRSAVSIPANIAEGDELGTNKQSIRHFFIAKGSAAELHTLLIIANEIGYIDEETRSNLVSECRKISIMLARLIKARSKN